MPHFGELPAIHHGRHETGGVDEVDVTGLHGQTLFVPNNANIANITETDVNQHFLDLEVALGETRKIIAVLLQPKRLAGTGKLSLYPNEGTWFLQTVSAPFPIDARLIVIADGTQRLQYAQTVANDNFIIYCFGYVVEI